ncbi:hypothetical protein BJ508DRAFT_21790 [Ascobolus immersus RN42]|uniref:Cyanovirin-N domain-containing protein n=1 Tax=Ascobolus immersus RN42 TaxID=1160509 RepID=A0A3N4HNH0_ASCIM|nr:hypothetical protein BJ508DRAFT_21790 [Ascobolus immersus RN42]
MKFKVPTLITTAIVFASTVQCGGWDASCDISRTFIAETPMRQPVYLRSHCKDMGGKYRGTTINLSRHIENIKGTLIRKNFGYFSDTCERCWIEKASKELRCWCGKENGELMATKLGLISWISNRNGDLLADADCCN